MTVTTRHNILRSRYVANTTWAPIANPPNSAQLGGIPEHSLKFHLGPCNSVGMQPWTDTDTHTQTDRRMWPQYISRGLRLMRNVTNNVSKFPVAAAQVFDR